MNRFHNKYHRHNHHTDPTTNDPDSSHDPIASLEDPFKGNFHLDGDLIGKNAILEGTLSCASVFYTGGGGVGLELEKLQIKPSTSTRDFCLRVDSSISAFPLMEVYRTVGVNRNPIFYIDSTTDPCVTVGSDVSLAGYKLNVVGQSKLQGISADNISLSGSITTGNIQISSIVHNIDSSRNYSFIRALTSVNATTTAQTPGNLLFITQKLGSATQFTSLQLSGTGLNRINNNLGIGRDPLVGESLATSGNITLYSAGGVIKLDPSVQNVFKIILNDNATSDADKRGWTLQENGKVVQGVLDYRSSVQNVRADTHSLNIFATSAGQLVKLHNSTTVASQGAYIDLYRSRAADIVAPSSLTKGDALGGIAAYGSSATSGFLVGSDIKASCSIDFVASEDFNTNSKGGYIQFQTVSPTDTTVTRRERVRIDDKGYIGINTISRTVTEKYPVNRLHIFEDVSTDPGIKDTIFIESRNTQAGIKLTTSNSTAGAGLYTDTCRIYANASSNEIVINNSDTSGRIVFEVGGKFDIGAPSGNSIKRHVITSQGDMGVGTLDPQARLHIIDDNRQIDSAVGAGNRSNVVVVESQNAICGITLSSYNIPVPSTGVRTNIMNGGISLDRNARALYLKTYTAEDKLKIGAGNNTTTDPGVATAITILPSQKVGIGYDEVAMNTTTPNTFNTIQGGVGLAVKKGIVIGSIDTGDTSRVGYTAPAIPESGRLHFVYNINEATYTPLEMYRLGSVDFANQNTLRIKIGTTGGNVTSPNKGDKFSIGHQTNTSWVPWLDVTPEESKFKKDIFIGGDLTVTGKITTLTTSAINTVPATVVTAGLTADGNIVIRNLSAVPSSIVGPLTLDDVTFNGGLTANGSIVAVSGLEVSNGNIQVSNGSITLTNGGINLEKGTIVVEKIQIKEGDKIKELGSTTSSSPEIGYIKKLAKCKYSEGNYLAITNDEKLVSWGRMGPEKFGLAASATIPAAEHVNYPFWTYWDGYTDSAKYKPYGSDFIESGEHEVKDIYWSKYAGMALVTELGKEEGDVWVAGLNTTTPGFVLSDTIPAALAVTKYNTFLIAENHSTNTNDRILLFRKNKDISKINGNSDTNFVDIVEDVRVTEGAPYFFYATATEVKRMNYTGETTTVIGTTAGLTAITSISMHMSGGTTYLFVCHHHASTVAQRYIAIYTIDNTTHVGTLNTRIVGTTLATLDSNIGDGSTTAGSTAAVAAIKFLNLKQITCDQSNPNQIVAYFIDGTRLRRLWRTSTAWRIDTLTTGYTNTDSTTGTTGFGAVAGNTLNSNVQLRNPQGIRVSNNSQSIFIATRGNIGTADADLADTTGRKIKRIAITNNTESSFRGDISDYANSNVTNLAKFNFHADSIGITKDNNGNLYIADTNNHTIRKIQYDVNRNEYTNVTRFAGSTKGMKDSNKALNAQFNAPYGIVYSATSSCLYVADSANHRIRKIVINTDGTAGAVSTVAGSSTSGDIDGSGTGARFNTPRGLAYGTYNNVNYIWVSDNTAYIRRIEESSTFQVTTIAGNGTAGNVPSVATTSRNTVKAQLIPAYRIPVAATMLYSDGKLYFSGKSSCRIYRLNMAENTITTLAGRVNNKNVGIAGSADGTGNEATLGSIAGNMAIVGNYLYFADRDNNKIRRISNFSTATSSTGTSVETIAGTGTKGSKNTTGSSSTFNLPALLIKHHYTAPNTSGSLVVGDVGSHLIRNMMLDDPYNVTKINGDGAGATNTTTTTIQWRPYALSVDKTDNSNIYFTDDLSNGVGRVDDKGNIEFYKKILPGSLGIGPSFGTTITQNPTTGAYTYTVPTNNINAKSTCGFVKVQITEDEDESAVKIKKIQLHSYDADTVIFAALDTEDSLWVWGRCPNGVFGTGQTGCIYPTKLYDFEKNVKDFSIISGQTTGGTGAGDDGGVLNIITKSGKMYSSGTNNVGQLGRGSASGNTVSHDFKIMKPCKKNATTEVDDAAILPESSVLGCTNNMYINTEGKVFACGAAAGGLLGSGSTSVTSPSDYYFGEITTIDQKVTKLIVGGIPAACTALALTEDKQIYSWGYNGVAGTAGFTGTGNSETFPITIPALCVSFETQSDGIYSAVSDAVYIFTGDSTAANDSQHGYITEKGELFLTGVSTETEAPDFPKTPIPYFRRYNVSNVAQDIVVVKTGTTAASDIASIARRNNGTLYNVSRYGPRKLL